MTPLKTRLTPGRLASAFRVLNVATGGRDYDHAARSVARHVTRRAPDPECRERSDLAAALAAFDVYIPGWGYDETAAKVVGHIGKDPWQPGDRVYRNVRTSANESEPQPLTVIRCNRKTATVRTGQGAEFPVSLANIVGRVTWDQE